ncbi:unnamed protein product [Oppiella nova]|uniref:Uncharacterized protein n=1 Tax=Oppiella nova TaxID=334625 RepID=A0A7R9L7M1_9ACAR|nr:unnamed protein product [Oppiella nova]CAG2157428.1 unnamed protein product [Oppiella nova]
MVILMDDEDRENEGDLVIAATHVRPEDINFMITHARGLRQMGLPLVFLPQNVPIPFKLQLQHMPNLLILYNLDISSH